MHNPNAQDTDSLYRVGALPRIKEAIDGVHAVAKLIPNTGMRQALLGHLHTLTVEMLHMQSNLSAHKRCIRDAAEVMQVAQRPVGTTPEGRPVLDAMIRAWAGDVQDALDGTTADHYGVQMKAEHPTASEPMPRVVQGMAGLPVPHARSA